MFRMMNAAMRSTELSLTCLRLTVEKADGRVGIANEGYWGIPVKPSTTYRASFYIKGTDRSEPPRWPWEPKPTTLRFRTLKIIHPDR